VAVMLGFLSSAQLPIHIKPVRTNTLALYLCQIGFKMDQRVQMLLVGNRERYILIDFLILFLLSSKDKATNSTSLGSV